VGAGSLAGGAQSGSPGSQEVEAGVGRTASRPGAGGPDGAAVAAGIPAQIAKTSSAGRVA